jgi:hypothetical protein
LFLVDQDKVDVELQEALETVARRYAGLTASVLLETGAASGGKDGGKWRTTELVETPDVHVDHQEAVEAVFL